MIPAGQLMPGTKGHSRGLLKLFLIIAQSPAPQASLFGKVHLSKLSALKKCIKLEVVYDEYDCVAESGQWAVHCQCEMALAFGFNV